MDSKETAKLSEQLKPQLQKLDTESLEVMANNHSKAIEYVKKGIEIAEWDISLSEEQIEAIANEMQIMTKMLLKERSTIT